MPAGNFKTTYEADMSLFDSGVRRTWIAIAIAAGLLLAFIPPGFWFTEIAKVPVLAIGALGLQIVTGFAGQVSLGHAFFIGLGAYVGAFIATPQTLKADDPTVIYDTWGLDWPWPIGVIAAGLLAALVGVIIGPAAVRLRGLYLGIVTLGLVIIGDNWLFPLKAGNFTGGPEVGRAPLQAILPGDWFPWGCGARIEACSNGRERYLVTFLVLVAVAFITKNLARSRSGRAWQAIRDRDVAAEVSGVPILKYKVMAFGVSSFFAGVCGALIAPVFSALNPQGTFGLELSILFIVMVIIGGVGTVAGAIMGTVFVQLVPAAIDFLVNRYDFIPFVTDSINEGGWVIATPQLELLLYGLSIILFLLFEPLGLFGIWIRVRNYFAAWPFSY